MGCKTLTISLSGLLGGHSGVGINKGHANALVSIATLLAMLRQGGVSYRVASFSGGQAKNAIPAFGTATIVLSATEEDRAKAIIETFRAEFVEAFGNIESDMVFTTTFGDTAPDRVLTGEVGYGITVRMSKRGDLTEDEAANLRFSTYARAEIMDLCGGNYDALDDTSVLAVRDRVKAQYAKEATIVASKALEDVAEANRRYDAASEKLLAQQATVKSSIGKLRRDARENADNRARNISYWVKNCAATLLIIIMIVSAVVTVATGVNDSKGIMSLAAIIISGGGAVSLWVPLLKLGKKLQDFVFIHTEGKMYMKELEKISPQIKLLEDILNSNSDS